MAVLPFALNCIWNKRQEKNRQLQAKESLRHAICTEMITLRNIYEPMKLHNKTPESGDDIHVVSLSQSYTIVFDSNADKLGTLDDSESITIITAYIKIKALMDTLLVYSARWEQYIHGKCPKNDVISIHKETYQLQQETLSAIDDAINVLQKYS